MNTEHVVFDILPLTPSETRCDCKDSWDTLTPKPTDIITRTDSMCAEDQVSREGGGPEALSSTSSKTHTADISNTIDCASAGFDNRQYGYLVGGQLIRADCPECEDLPDSFQAGQKVRVVGLSNAAYNGVEGTLGEWDPTKGRWPIISKRKTFCVKPSNIEKVGLDKADLLSSFMRSAERFEYHAEEYNIWVFDKVWDHANAHGDVEYLIGTIADDEKQFNNIYIYILIYIYICVSGLRSRVNVLLYRNYQRTIIVTN